MIMALEKAFWEIIAEAYKEKGEDFEEILVEKAVEY